VALAQASRLPPQRPLLPVHRLAQLQQPMTRSKHDGLTEIQRTIWEALNSEPRRMWSRMELRELVWGPHCYSKLHIVDVHVSNLRKIKGKYAIWTIRGHGFMLATDVHDTVPAPGLQSDA
jgi:DNA-binding response OmpR family regulator